MATNTKGTMRLNEALDKMQLAYNPMTKQLQFVTPKPKPVPEKIEESKPDNTNEDGLDVDRLSKKSSFSDEGNYSLSTTDTNNSPKSTLSGHQRGKDGGSFSSTGSSLSECSLGSQGSKEDEEKASPAQADEKLKKKGLSGFFSRGVFPWKSGGSKSQSQETGSGWKLFGKSGAGAKGEESVAQPVPPAAASTPQRHRRQGSSASEKQFEDLVASSIALIQHDRPSNLPAKCVEEALRHRQEHARMVAAARRRAELEAAARRARVQDSLRHEERLAAHAREWTNAILPRWQQMRSAKRTLDLWWSGLPPSVRGKVWQLAIDNKLNITLDMYYDLVAKAKQKLLEAQQRRKKLKLSQSFGCCDEKLQSRKEKSIDEVDKAVTKSIDNVNGETNDLNYFNDSNDTAVRTDNYSETSDKEERKCNYNVVTEVDAARNKQSESEDVSKLNHNSRDSVTSHTYLSKETHDSKSSHTYLSKETHDSESSHTYLSKETQDSESSHTNYAKGIYDSETSHRNPAKETHLAIPKEDANRLQNGMHKNYSESNLTSRAEVTDKLKSSQSNPDLGECGDECSMELIQLDISRTFPHLCIFQPGGPYFDVLHELLAAYVCYRPDIGYVQGMSFIAAVLILNMEAPAAFVCFANLLDGPVLKAAFCRDGATMQRLWKAFSLLVEAQVPALAGRVAPELYLVEWVYTAFAKALPLDAACRLWDVFLRDGDAFLFHAALGVLHMYQDELKEMDFIAAAQFLTKLPEDLCPDALFRSIAAVSMSLDGTSFEELAASTDIDEESMAL